MFFCTFAEDEEAGRRQNQQSTGTDRLSCDPLAVILLALHSARYSGLGTNLITASFDGDTIYGYDWILKLLLTIATLAIGFQGGEVTPLFSIGASLGVVLGSALGVPPVVCASLGYAAVFGSATNTVIAPILIGLEVFGSQNAIPLVVVCLLAYMVNGIIRSMGHR